MNLLSSTSVFGFYTLVSRFLGYLRDILIAIFLGTSIYADAFLLLLDFQTLSEDYLLKVHLMPHLYQVTQTKKLKEKKLQRNLLMKF